MRFTARRLKSDDHEIIESKLDEHDQRLKEMSLRLRRLEIEAGIYKPPLKGVKSDSG